MGQEGTKLLARLLPQRFYAAFLMKGNTLPLPCEPSPRGRGQAFGHSHTLCIGGISR